MAVAATTGWPWLPPRAVAATTGRGGHHGQTVVPTARTAVFPPSNDAFCPFVVIRGLLVLGYLLWAFFGLFASSLS